MKETTLALVKSEQFGEVVADIYRDGSEVYMTINQLAECLGYASTAGIGNIIGRNPYLDAPEFSVTHSLCAADGKAYTTRLFTEDGIYEITMLSKQPKAQEFRAWIRGVIKSIRKHGVYMTPERLLESLRSPEGLMTALCVLADEQRANAKLKTQVLELLPKAEFADAVAESEDCVSFGEMAKILRQNGLPYGRTRMCAALRRDGFLIRQNCADYNTPTQDAMERGVFYHCKHVKEMTGGFLAATHVTRVTGKGQQVLLQHFQRKHRGAGDMVA